MESDLLTAQTLKVASVILDTALDKPLDYLIPQTHWGKLQSGMRVRVPLQKTVRLATVLEIKAESSFHPLQPIHEILTDKLLIYPDLMALVRWIAHYYCTPLHKVLRYALPPAIRKMLKPKEQLFIQSTLSAPDLLSYCQAQRMKHPKQAQVLDVLLKHPKGLLLSLLMQEAGVERGPISTLIKKKILHSSKIQIDRSALDNQEYFPTKRKVLSSEQQKVLECIKQDLGKAKFQTRLIHGITGSGKTEIYLQAIEHTLLLGKGVIFLVPEIALTSQTIERLKGRFKEKIAILHHRLSDGERCDTWHHIHQGRAPIVVGARSAIFSPIEQLGLILVDEEHEASYKQSEEPPTYHARDVAVMRGKLSQAVVLLGSATPSLESYYNALKGKYALDELKNRADAACLPLIHLVDMRKEYTKARGFTLFSEQLIDAIKTRCALGEQTLLFLNRRGYHTARTCLHCQKPLKCPHCDINLTFHLGENLLACHLCGYHLSPLPRCCPYCKTQENFKFQGAGTEMVERALHALFPTIRTLRMDGDTTRHKGSHELLFKQFKAGKADVLIGTQMIAKGLHFPSVTLVGVLNADASLQIPDYRSSENLFQLLTQVAGRSGRGALPGEVIIQTQMPDHPLIALAKEQDYKGFYTAEIAVRKEFSYPPFTHLVKLLFRGKKEHATQEYAHKTRNFLMQHLPSTVQLFPVLPCGYARIKENFRFHFLLKAHHIQPLLPHLRTLQTNKHPYGIYLSIDIDSQSTF